MQIECFVTTPYSENCYVLKEGQEAMVIDPGEATPELLASLEGFEVKMLINTHAHIDHVGGNAGVMAATGAELICHADAVLMLENLQAQGQMLGYSVEASPKPDRLVDEGDTINFGGQEIKVLNTPGHADGHISLAGEGYVFGGDALFMGSIGRTDLPGGSMEVLLNSIKTRLFTLPDDTVVLSGHGPTTTIGQEKATNPFLQGLND